MTMSPEMTPRTDHAYAVYDAAFGRLLPDARTIADIGAGESEFGIKLAEQGRDVLRVDAQYAQHPPKGANYLAADARHMPEVQDGSFDLTLGAYLFQHVEHGNGDAARIVQEMVRITDEGGYIALFPVWRPRRLQGDLPRDFYDVAKMGFLFNDHPYGVKTPAEREIERNHHQTLVIRKDSALSIERMQALATLIESSGALTKRRSLSDRARAAIISSTGETRRYVRYDSI